MKSFAKGRYHLNAPQEIILVKFLSSIGTATLVTVTSLYLNHLGLSISQIGIITAITYALSLVFALLLPPFLEKHNIDKLLVIAIAVFAINLAALGSASKATLAIFLFFTARTVVVLIDTTASILFKDDNTTTKNFYKNTAMLGSLVSLAWTLTPLIAGALIESRSFSYTYALAGVTVMLGAIFLLLNPVPVIDKHRMKIDDNLLSNMKFYFSNRHLRDAYIMNMGVNVWWGFIFTFVALFMIDAGYSKTAIGLFITLTQAPLFLLEFKANIIVDRFGFRIPFVISYFLLACACFIGFVFGVNTAVLAMLLIASITIAYIEPAREMFVYSGLKQKDEEKAYPIFSTGIIFGSVTVRVLVSIVLITLDYKFSFFIVGLVMLYISRRAYRITEK